MKLLQGNNLELLKQLPDNSVDAVVTDPPYGLGKEPDALAMLRDWLETGHHDVKGRGFMGKEWDAFVPQPRQWREIYRVLKPGGHVLAFAGTRTQDLMALGLRLAGFEIRDLVAWVYSTGFPKSHNFGCKCSRDALSYIHEENLPREPKAERNLHPLRNSNVSPSLDIGERRGEVLQPCLSQSGASIEGREQLPTSKVRSGESSLEGGSDILEEARKLQADQVCPVPKRVLTDGEEGRIHYGTPFDNGRDARALPIEGRSRASCEPQPAGQPTGESGAIPKQRGAQEGGVETDQVCAKCGKPADWQGWGTALKPALEPITLARKPLEGTVAENVLKWHTGAVNVDGCRVETSGSLGRWPSNFIHDGSEEVTELFPESKGQLAPSRSDGTPMDNAIYGAMKHGTTSMKPRGDTGSAARFFYCAKASKKDRGEGNGHPTIKPTDLMRYLCRLITPPGGVVLDPWMGSGSTGKAAKLEGFDFIGMEMDKGYFEIACARTGYKETVEEWI